VHIIIHIGIYINILYRKRFYSRHLDTVRTYIVYRRNAETINLYDGILNRGIGYFYISIIWVYTGGRDILCWSKLNVIEECVFILRKNIVCIRNAYIYIYTVHQLNTLYVYIVYIIGNIMMCVFAYVFSPSRHHR